MGVSRRARSLLFALLGVLLAAPSTGLAGCARDAVEAGGERQEGGGTGTGTPDGTSGAEQAEGTAATQSPPPPASTSEADAGTPAAQDLPVAPGDASVGESASGSDPLPPGAAASGAEPGTRVPPALGPSAGIDPAVRNIIRRIMAPIHACFARELERNPSFQSAVPPPTLRPVPSARGPLRMELVGTSGSARVDRCLRQALRRLSLERDAREVHVQYPFLFTSEGEPRALPLGD